MRLKSFRTLLWIKRRREREKNERLAESALVVPDDHDVVESIQRAGRKGGKKKKTGGDGTETGKGS